VEIEVPELVHVLSLEAANLPEASVRYVDPGLSQPLPCHHHTTHGSIRGDGAKLGMTFDVGGQVVGVQLKAPAGVELILLLQDPCNLGSDGFSPSRIRAHLATQRLDGIIGSQSLIIPPLDGGDPES
jgi:hypothetical protein